MNTPSKIARTIEISGMSGDVCVKKVTDSLKAVAGVTVQGVKVGSAVVVADHDGCSAACSAIDAAGFRRHESKVCKDAGVAAHPMPATASKADAHQPQAVAGAPPASPVFAKKPEQAASATQGKIVQPAK